LLKEGNPTFNYSAVNFVSERWWCPLFFHCLLH